MSIARYILVVLIASTGCTTKPSNAEPAPKPTPSRSLHKVDANPDGIWGLSPDLVKPRVGRASPTQAEVLSILKVKPAPPILAVNRGTGHRQFTVERDGIAVDFVFPTDPDAGLLWFDTRSPGVCVDALCVGSPFTNTSRLGTATYCTGSDDGQGFNATWTCSVPGLTSLNLWVAVPDAQNFKPGLPGPENIAKLIAAKATVIGFIWVSDHENWSAERYDEGDR
jgi:hypothetical protein